MRNIDSIASEMIPIRLIISIIIIAAIAAMVGMGFATLNTTFAENKIESDCKTLETNLYSMLNSGVARDVDEIGADDGTKRVQTFDIPDNVIYLAFGVDPDPNNDGILETGLTNNGSIISYRVSGGSKHIIWLDEQFRFREGNNSKGRWDINDQGFIISDSGKITLIFELVEKNHETYILIQSNDNIEP